MDRKILPARFFNCGDHGVAIVAVVNYSDAIYDWAAYVGYGSVQTKEACYIDVSKSGNKLSREDALYYFPNLPIEKWRS